MMTLNSLGVCQVRISFCWAQYFCITGPRREKTCVADQPAHPLEWVNNCRLTAGSAKKDIANTEKQDATILPIQVCGTVSP